MPSVLSLGSGGSGQLGIGRVEEALGIAAVCTFDILPEPSSMPLNVVGGGNHSVMLFDDGSLYAAGDNTSGACGHHLHKRLLTFHKVNIPNVSRFRLVAATWTASILVTTDERVFVCGEGTRGELGLGHNITKVLTPVELVDFPPSGHSIIQMSASFRHVAVVVRENRSGKRSLWGWGAGRHGELGADARKMPGGMLWKPGMIISPHVEQSSTSSEPKHVVCGRDFSYMLGGSGDDPRGTVDGTIFGKEKHGIASPASLALTGVIVPYATWSSVYLHLQDHGRVIIQGKDCNGSMANRAFPRVSMLRTGSEHAIAKLQDGRLVACGWNEHLNCGVAYAQDVSDSSLYNVLDESVHSYPLGCGCATTFFVRAGPQDEYTSGSATLDILSS